MARTIYNNETVYKVTKKTNNRTIRKFDTMEEAQAWVWTREPQHEGYRVYAWNPAKPNDYEMIYSY